MISFIVCIVVNVMSQNYNAAPPRNLPVPRGGLPVHVLPAFQLLKISQVDTSASTVSLQAYYDEFWSDLSLSLPANYTPITNQTDALGCTLNNTFGDRCDPARGKRFYLAQFVPWAPDNTFVTGWISRSFANH
jgi:hypothetical protein